MSDLLTVRLFEVTMLVLYIWGAVWIWRLRNPVFLGALAGATLLYGFDWMWITKGFFNVTYNENLIWFPGMEIMGIREPLIIPFSYGMAFGPFIVMLVCMKDFFDKKGGYPLVWLIGAVGVMLYEIPVVYWLEIWTYHQKPSHMIWGVPWSDIWLAGNMVTLGYAGVRYMDKWAQIPAGDFSGPAIRKGLVMGALPVWGAFYVTYLLQLFWYSAAEPWVNSGRPF